MNKKLTVNTLAKSSILKRKKQYALMIIGILIALIFSSTIIFFVFSLFNSAQESQKRYYGDFSEYVIMNDFNEDVFKQGIKEDVYQDYGLSYGIGALCRYKSSDLYDIYVSYLDQKGEELYYPALSEGSMPSQTGEIAVEEWVVPFLGDDIKIGDTFTVDFKGQNGEKLFDNSVKKTFKLTGILLTKNPLDRLNGINIGSCLPSCFVYSQKDCIQGTKELVGVFAKYTEPIDDYNSPYDFLDRNGGTNYHYNNFKDNSMSNFILSDTSVPLIFSSIFLLLAFISVINTMNTGLANRKKQIGLLKTVGATKKQIINIYGREALLLSLICTPVSLVCSIFGVKILFSFVPDYYVFIPNYLSLAVSGAVGILSVMVAAFIPLYKASKVSPIQSIRNIEMARTMKKSKIKSQKDFKMSALVSKRIVQFNRGKQIFISAVLAVTVIFSCYSFSVFKSEVKASEKREIFDYSVNSGVYSTMLMNDISANDGFNENQRLEIMSNPYFSKVYSSKNVVSLMELEEYNDFFKLIDLFSGFDIRRRSYDFQANKIDFNISYLKTKEFLNNGKDFYPVEIIGFDDTIFEEMKSYVVEGKINIDKIKSGEEIILFSHNKVGLCMEDNHIKSIDFDDELNPKVKKYSLTAEREIKAGDTVNLNTVNADLSEYKDSEGIKLTQYTYPEGYEDWYVPIPDKAQKTVNTVKIGAVINELPQKYCLFADNNFYFITSNDIINKYNKDADYSSFCMDLKKSIKDKMTDETDAYITNSIKDICSTSNNNYYESNYEMLSQTKDNYKTIFTVVLSIMAVVFAGCASIINNSLTSQIRESKRKTGTLRAVGASQRDLTMCYVRQLLSMFGFGIGIGFIMFFASYFIINTVLNYLKKPLDLTVTVYPAVIASIIMFIICSLNLYFKIKKETKSSIIENIREL